MSVLSEIIKSKQTLVFQLLVNQEKGHALVTRKKYLNDYKLSENNPWTERCKDHGWKNHTKELMIITIIYLLFTSYYPSFLLSCCTTELYILIYAVLNYSTVRVVVLKFRVPHLRTLGINTKVLMPTNCLQLGMKELNKSI